MDYSDDDFSFEESTHTYRNKDGIVRPSVTTCLKACGLFDYSKVPPEILENARRRGSNVHAMLAEHARGNEVDELMLAEDEVPYFQAGVKFVKESGIAIKQIETPMLTAVMGIEVGGTPDIVGFLGQHKYIIDWKTGSVKDPAWALQIALYELMITQKPRCGHMGRMVVQLKKDGRYSTIEYTAESDAAPAIGALQITAWRYNANK